MDATSPMEGQKPSRYRSVRQQQNSSPAPQEQDTIQRSRSRYHRRPGTANENQSPAAQARSPDHDSHDQSQRPTPRRMISGDGSLNKSYQGRHGQSDASAGAQDHGAPRMSFESEGEDDDVRRRRLQEQYGRHPRHDEQSPRRRTDSPITAPEPRRPSNKAEVRFDQAPQVIHARKEREIGPQDEVISDDESHAGCFSGLFKKKRFDPIKNVSEKPAPARSSPKKSKNASNIQAGGGGGSAVPGFDAPMSASNAGERRVLVEYKKRTIQFPVTQETTAMDLINSASNVFSETIDARASILLEHFGTVGVQRPLRRFERVKDVMNSWDDDKANSLLLIPSRAADANPSGLSATNVPGNRPMEASFLMYYSQRPGHWDKRLIVIREDGQIVMSKPKDKEPTTVCHLSDFDIYTPTATALAKKIKPPKKYCYGIKSQQKTSMFLEQSQYVHFLCASDKTHGTSFYDAVQGWRSWYLVHVMGEGVKTPKIGTTGGVQRSPSKATKSPVHVHQATDSVGSHYQLGSFRPMDMSQFDRPSSSGSREQTQAPQPPTHQMPSRKLSTRDRNHPPSSFPRKMLADDEPLVNMANNRRPSVEVRDDDDTFNNSGLLGRSYSTRRREAADREEANSSPFTGNGLVGGITTTIEGGAGVTRQTSIKHSSSRRGPNNLAHRPSTREGPGHASGVRRNGSVDLGHSGSIRRAPAKPLVDLTPTYVPPPQHVRKGGAYRPSPDELRSGPLIEAATSGEKSWRDEIPETRDWRGRARGGGGAGGDSTPNRTRSRSRSANPTTHSGSNNSGSNRVPRYASPNNAEESAFTGGGYLAHTQSQSHATRPASKGGRNVNSGHGQGPLLDVSDGANFAKGSLLAKLDRESPKPGPVIDREG